MRARRKEHSRPGSAPVCGSRRGPARRRGASAHHDATRACPLVCAGAKAGLALCPSPQRVLRRPFPCVSVLGCSPFSAASAFLSAEGLWLRTSWQSYARCVQKSWDESGPGWAGFRPPGWPLSASVEEFSCAGFSRRRPLTNAPRPFLRHPRDFATGSVTFRRQPLLPVRAFVDTCERVNVCTNQRG
jgi:hypothetical protein